MHSADSEQLVSKRINVTLADSVLNDLEWWAKSQGRPTANLASFLIEMSIRPAKEQGEFPPLAESPARNPLR